MERAHRRDVEVEPAGDEQELDSRDNHVPGRRTLVELAELEQLARRLGIERLALLQDASALVPGRRTRVDDTQGALGARSPSHARFDELRIRGLRELLGVAAAHSSSLGDAMLGVADPAIARAVAPSTASARTRSAEPVAANANSGWTAGHAMWRAAERYAATLYRRALDSGELDQRDPAIEAALRRCGMGQPLAPEVQRSMSAALGVSLDRVRVHTDEVADAAARALHAEAFTVGEDIFFATGAFAPETPNGQRLLAHELTHVVQAWQGRTGSDGKVSEPGDPLEREADAVADRVAASAPAEAPASAPANAPSSTDAPKPRSNDDDLVRPASTAAPTLAPPAAATAELGPVTPGPIAAQPAAEQPLLRRAAVAGGGPQRATMPGFKGGAKSPAKRGLQGMQATSNEFSERAGGAAKNVAGKLDGEIAQTKGKPPGQGAKAQVKAARAAGEAEERTLRAAERDHRANAALQAGEQGDAAEAPGERRASPADAKLPVKFKPITSWAKYMPQAMPDQDEREKARIEKLVRTKIEGERAQASQALEGLRKAHLSQAREVRAMKPKLVAQVQAAQQQALAHVARAEAAQVAAVQGHIATVQGQVRGHAASMKGQVTAAHAAAVAKINAQHQAAEQKLSQDRTKADADVNAAQNTALVVLGLDFSALGARYTSLGGAKAGDAITVGEGQARGMSGRWDGEKLEAAQKAARDTADGFATSMPEQTSQQWSQISAEQPAIAQGLRDYATGTKTNIGTIFDQSKQALDTAKTQTIQAADTAKSGAITQIDQACASTVASLAAQGASQVAAIRQQAQGARAGITQAGAAGRTGVAQSCDAAAAGIEGGVAGLIRGAAQVEAPDPAEFEQMALRGATELEKGGGGVAKGMSAAATNACDGLSQQASGAAEGMAAITAALRTSANQAASGAKQQMTAIASGAKQAQSQLAASHKTTADQAVTGAQTAFGDQVKALTQGYTDAATARATQFNDGYNQFAAGLHQTVPNRGGGGGGRGSGKKEEGGGEGGGGGPQGEIPAIQDAAQKAADAVKPWWQKALAVVVSIVVAIVVVVVVTALIATTGPVGMILVGALAGALSTFAASVASNLVLGNSPLEGITWQSIAIGALGGAISGGITAGIGAAAKAGVTGARAITSAQGATTSLRTAAGLRTALIKNGTEFVTDFVSEQAATLMISGKLDISVENLVIGVVANGVTGSAKFETFQGNVQQAISRPIRGGVNVPGLQIQIGNPRPPGGVPAAGGAPGQAGPAATPPASTPGAQAPAGAPPARGANTPAADTPAPTAPAPTAPAPSAAAPTPAPATPTTRPTGDTGAPPTRAPDVTTRPGDNGPAPQPTDGSTPPPASDASPNRPDRPAAEADPAARPPGSEGPSARPDGDASPHADADGPNARPDADGPNARPDGEGPNARPDGEGPNARPDADGPNARPDGEGPNGRPNGETANARPGADQPNARPDSDGPNARPDGDSNGPSPDGEANAGGPAPRPAGNDGGSPDAAEVAAVARDTELSELGYPAGTRQRGQEAASRIAQGEVPPRGALRDTEANVRGAEDLAQLRSDPTMSPDQRTRVQRDLGDTLAGRPEPTGNLARDVAAARARAAEAGPDTGASGAINAEGSTYRGDVAQRNNATNIRAGVTEALPNLAGLFPPGRVRQTGPDRVEIDINGTVHEVRIEVVPNSQLANASDVANFDLSTTPITVRVSAQTHKAHVERALAHEIAEISSTLTQRAGGTARPDGNNLRPNNTAPRALSHDDIGRLAELRVLMNDMNGPGRRNPNTDAEMRALLTQLGLLAPDGTRLSTSRGSSNVRQLVEREGIRMRDVERALGLEPLPTFVGTDEAGDMYHVAGAAALDPSMQVDLVTGTRDGALPPPPLPPGVENTPENRAAALQESTPLSINRPDQVGSRDGGATGAPGMNRIRDESHNPTTATSELADAIRSGDIERLRNMDLRVDPGRRQEISNFLDTVLAGADGRPLVGYWNRAGDHAPHRNSQDGDLGSFHQTAEDGGVQVVVLGHNPDGAQLDIPSGAIDLTRHWERGGPSNYAEQLEMFRMLADRGMIGQVGMMSGGMDGAFLFAGIPTVEVGDPHRMGQWDEATRLPDGSPGDFRVVERPNNEDGSTGPLPDLADDIRRFRENGEDPPTGAGSTTPPTPTPTGGPTSGALTPPTSSTTPPVTGSTSPPVSSTTTPPTSSVTVPISSTTTPPTSSTTPPTTSATPTPTPTPSVSNRVTLRRPDGSVREVDMREIETLVQDVISAADPAVLAAARQVNPRNPDGAIRDAVLVFYRNGRDFDSMDALVDATRAKLALQEQVMNVDWDGDVMDIVHTHPERGEFRRALEASGMDPAKIDALWEIVIRGVHYQKGLNDAGRKTDPNPHYAQLADEMADLLAIQPGDMPALWSGGYDVSMYAQNAGYRTLEVTAAGKLFDQLKLFRDFSTLGPLWNGISRRFVDSFGGEIHVFIRTIDKDSVLYKQELAELMGLEGVVGVRWHVIQGGSLTDITPVDASGTADPNHDFDGYREAAGAMTDDQFRAPTGSKKIDGEPDTPEGVRDRMVNEQVDMPGYVADLHSFADEQAIALGVDGPAYRAEIERFKARAELRLKNDPALGVELAALHAEIRDMLAKQIQNLARTRPPGGSSGTGAS